MYEDFILYGTSPPSDLFPFTFQQSTADNFANWEPCDFSRPHAVQEDMNMALNPTDEFVSSPASCESECAPFFYGLPSTPMGPEQLDYSYDPAMAIGTTPHEWLDSGSYENFRGVAMATLDQSWEGFDGNSMVRSSFCAVDMSGVSLFGVTASQEVGSSDNKRQQQTCLCASPCCSDLQNCLQGLTQMAIDMTHEIREAKTESSKLRSGNSSLGKVTKASLECDFPGCKRHYTRMEHLKRHKQTTHAKRIKRFCCEFCGKDQFNRHDNLLNHRKLHARAKSRNPRVRVIPAAASVIEEANRSGKYSV
ncbi:uncharacterized protein FFNC_15586 [Fusarium fujikuroi]|nr:uncharacterized protein FFNC_15586 [Fusarium fujikuroi]